MMRRWLDGRLIDGRPIEAFVGADGLTDGSTTPPLETITVH